MKLVKIKAGHYETERFIIAKYEGKWSYCSKSSKTHSELCNSIYTGRIFWGTLRDLKDDLCINDSKGKE